MNLKLTMHRQRSAGGPRGTRAGEFVEEQPSNTVRRMMVARKAAMMVFIVWMMAACGRPDIAERPTEDATPSQEVIETKVSTVAATASIELGELVKAVNQALPAKDARGWTKDPNACKKLFWHKVCARYTYTWERSKIEVRPVGDKGVELVTHLRVNGAVGLTGDGAKLMGVDSKAFKGALVMRVVAEPVMGKDWCPALKLRTSYTWETPVKVEVVHGIWVTVRSHVEPAIDAQLSKLVKQGAQTVDCAKFEADLAELFTSRSVELPVAGSKPMYVNVVPVGMAFSGVHVVKGQIVMAAMIQAKVDVAAEPVQPRRVKVPPYRSIDPGKPPMLSLAVPVRAPAAVLQEQARRLVVGKTFEAQTPLGAAKATIEQLEVYPTTNGRVAVGIGFQAKLPGKWLDTKGTVYLLGTPTALGKTVVGLRGASFTRSLDNEVWSALSVVFDSKIRAALEEGLRYDFGKEVDQARQMLAEVVKDPELLGGAKVSVTGVDMGVGRVGMDGAELVAEATIQAQVSAAFDAGSLGGKP